MPLFSSPSTQFMSSKHGHVFSIIKDGNKEQTFIFRVTNRSALDAYVRIAVPFNGKTTSFLIFSVLPVRQLIKAFDTKSFSIKIKVDLKKAGMSDVSDLLSRLGLSLDAEDSLSSKSSPRSPKKEPEDQEIRTLIALQVADSEVQVTIPFRIHYKTPVRYSKSFSLYG